MKNIILIEKYLNNELSGKSLDEFEKQLRTDKCLQEDLKIMKELKELIIFKSRDVNRRLQQEEEFMDLLIAKIKSSNSSLVDDIEAIKAELYGEVEPHIIKWADNELFLFEEFVAELISYLEELDRTEGKISEKDRAGFISRFISLYNTYIDINKTTEIYSIRKENSLPFTSEEKTIRESLHKMLGEESGNKMDESCKILTSSEINEYNQLLEREISKNTCDSGTGAGLAFGMPEIRSEKKSFLHLKKPVAVLVTVLCIPVLAVTIFLAMNRSGLHETEKNLSLFNDYYKPCQNILVSRSTMEQPGLSKAMAAYDNGDFEKAFLLLKKVEAKCLYSELAMQLYMAICLLETGKTIDAVNLLQDLTGRKDGISEISVAATWYLGLCCLKSGEVEKASLYLKEVSRSECSYSDDAEALLTKMK